LLRFTRNDEEKNAVMGTLRLSLRAQRSNPENVEKNGLLRFTRNDRKKMRSGVS